MSEPTRTRRSAVARLLRATLVTLALAPPLFAQVPLRVTIPGSAFAPTGRSAKFEDVSGGRQFRGAGFSKLLVRATLPVPPASEVDPKVQAVSIHFRSSRDGPSLRDVKVNGASMNPDLNLKGDYLATERTTPATLANAWVFKSTPMTVRGQVTVLLEIQFPGGFDSAVDPGAFLLHSVVVDFPRSAASFTSKTVSPGATPALRKP
jgi:hypothetical protein